MVRVRISKHLKHYYIRLMKNTLAFFREVDNSQLSRWKRRRYNSELSGKPRWRRRYCWQLCSGHKTASVACLRLRIQPRSAEFGGQLRMSVRDNDKGTNCLTYVLLHPRYFRSILQSYRINFLKESQSTLISRKDSR